MCNPNILKQKDIKVKREELLEDQDYLCALCKQPINEGDRVHLDHEHSRQLGNGEIRASLHSFCNMMLGKCENNFRRNKINYYDFPDWLRLAADYMDHHREHPSGLVHNSERSKANLIKRNQTLRDELIHQRELNYSVDG